MMSEVLTDQTLLSDSLNPVCYIRLTEVLLESATLIYFLLHAWDLYTDYFYRIIIIIISELSEKCATRKMSGCHHALLDLWDFCANVLLFYEVKCWEWEKMIGDDVILINHYWWETQSFIVSSRIFDKTPPLTLHSEITVKISVN